MPTKRELRELEDTVQLSAAEIERAENQSLYMCSQLILLQKKRQTTNR